MNKIPNERKTILELEIFDTEKLKEDLEYILKNYVLVNTGYNNELTVDWKFFPLSKYENQTDCYVINEKFNIYKWSLVPEIKNLYIETLINSLVDNYIDEFYLIFLSKVPPGKQISAHKDMYVPNHEPFLNNEAIRMHIPIQTDRKVTFGIGDPRQIIYRLEAGKLYFLRTCDTTHWVKNNSTIDRYHIMIDAKPSQKLLDLIDKKN